MRFGKPVFISNNTSLPEVGGEHAFYWDHYEPEYMAQVLREGMTKVTERPAYYRDWYVERAEGFNWNDTAQKYLEVYKTILNA